MLLFTAAVLLGIGVPLFTPKLPSKPLPSRPIPAYMPFFDITASARAPGCCAPATMLPSFCDPMMGAGPLLVLKPGLVPLLPVKSYAFGLLGAPPGT